MRIGCFTPYGRADEGLDGDVGSQIERRRRLDFRNDEQGGR